MSGDVQPRKRKDKKKKKDDDPIPEKLHVPIFTNNTVTDDVNIHVHKEGGTGGGICAKLVFFILFSALAVLIGLIITEHRGLTDIETVDPNSKFSQLFEGWVDANVESHDDHDIEEHGSIEDDDHEDHDDQDDDEDHNDNQSEEVDENDHEDEDDEDENNNQLDENLDDEDDENEQEDEDDEDDGINEIDDEDDDDEDDLDYYTQTKKTAPSEEEEQEQEDEDEQDNNDSQAIEEPDQDEEDQEEDEEYDKYQEVSREKRDISEEKLDDQQDDDVDNDNADDQNIDEEDNDEANDTKDDDVDEAKDGDDEDKIDSNEKETKEKQAKKHQQDDVVEKEEEDDDEKLEKTGTEPEDELKDDAAESSSMAVKLGVGVALLVVAHLVLVKKWRTAPDESDTTEPTSVPNLQDRRNTIIVPPSFKEVEPDIEQVQEDYSEEEEDIEEDEKVETNVAKTKYQEIATAYIRPSPAEKKFDTARSTKTYEYEDDEEIDDENEQEDEELEEEEEEEEEEAESGEEYDDEEVDDEDEELLKRLEARYGKLHKDNAHKTAESRESDSDKQSDDEDYDYTNITNADDYRIRKEIDEAQGSIKNNNALAVALFDKILQNFPSSPRSLYGKALALDDLAERKRSNDILEQALQLYEKVLKIEKVPSTLFNIVADRYINRLRFLGQYRKSITVHKIIIDRFPNNPKHLNSLGVTYLTMNRVEEARSIFKQVLTKWPENGFALVHYGFILKTTDKALKKSIRYLEKGIRTKDEGVIDGRFYFHLGDALARLGRNNDAVKVYEEGTKNKVFLSKYQRSLYNVPRLSSKPWWSSKDLPYTNSLRLLSESWKKIREEGLTILSESGYFQDESENLKDTGDWKQFELYARGQKNVKNCKKCPFTCNIIDQIPEAKSCRRGQTKFSVMHPGTHVWPHCGPTNCRVRIHLGLKVPLNTFIRVAENTKSWKEGELLVFDDSFEHEVWHNGSEFRLILIVDVWHPELTPSERFNLSPI